MAKISQESLQNTSNETNNNSSNKSIAKAKQIRKRIPRVSQPQRTSIYKGVTRHRCTGRYEAHLWDKSCWNKADTKKGRQVYLGAYDDEVASAHAYDLAALKYWGHETILNFPLSTYQEELKEMDGQSKEEYIGSLRRKSNGFSRGVSKYRGVARHHHNGRWEARIGRVCGNKYLYLGTYATQEEAAAAYDKAAIEYRGINALTNFDLSCYINWLPLNCSKTTKPQSEPNLKFEEMVGRTSPDNCPLTPPEMEALPRRLFPDDIETYFDFQGSSSSACGDDIIFGELSSFAWPMVQCEPEHGSSHFRI